MNPDVTNSTDGGSASASRPGRTGVNLICKLLGRNHHSRETARRRLRLVLAHDRSGIPPELLNVIRSDIIMVISKHVVVDREATEIRLAHDQGRTTLEANIPIVRTHQTEAGGQPSTTQR